MRPSPPPPPSARRTDLQYADPQQQYADPQQYPDPTAHGMPYYADPGAIDPTAATVEAGTIDGEPNPFKKPSRWRSWLKRPSREFMVRGGVAVLAAALGWGVGAKPWKSEPPAAAKVAVANKAAARPAVKAPPARRVAVSTPAPAAPAAKSRTATAPAATTQKKTTATTPAKTQVTAKAPATTTKTAAKPVAKTTTKPATKVASKPKATTSGSTAK